MLKSDLLQTNKNSIKIVLCQKNLRFLRRSKQKQNSLLHYYNSEHIKLF
jgi:hypothetical protein